MTNNAQQQPPQQPTSASALLNNQQDSLTLKQLVTKVNEIRRHMVNTQQPDVRTLADLNTREAAVGSANIERLPHKPPLTLEQIERKRMEQDRAGILFSNVLRQVRGQIH